jgi:hypothetical protein
MKSDLNKALSDPDVTSYWTEAERIVAQILNKDFSNSAIQHSYTQTLEPTPAWLLLVSADRGGWFE